MNSWNLSTNETASLLPFEVLKILKTDHFRDNQSFSYSVGFEVQSSGLN